MRFKKKRVTVVMGAGAVLDFSFPDGVIKPTTNNITDVVRQPYRSSIPNDHSVNIVEDAYKLLEASYGDATNVCVNFEMVYHALETYFSFNNVWELGCRNKDMYPVFAPFTKPERCYKQQDLMIILKEYLIRIVEIVNAYDKYFANNKDKEQWYVDFFKSSKFKWDVFNFNYDTTVENCLEKYEDGFGKVDETGLRNFEPARLYKTKKNTINHLHGCISYYFRFDKTNDYVQKYSDFDGFKYHSAEDVLKTMRNTGNSLPRTQGGEEFYSLPIITGLHKTDKLTNIPFDFYYGNVHKRVVENNAMIIIGYSFGDLYMNDVINRLNLIHGKKKRIVLIDYWGVASNDKKELLWKVHKGELSKGLVDFLQIMSDQNTFEGFVNTLDCVDKNGPMRTNNSCLMLFIGGFKEASKYKKEINKFIKS